MRSPAPPRLYSCFFLSFFFRCFQGLQKIKIKTSYLIKGTEVGMHDQCHRLNNLILTFLANFVKGQSSARIRRILETCLILQWVFSHTVKKTNKQETLTNSKVGICKTSVWEFCGHAFHSWRISEDLRNAEPDSWRNT